MGACWCVSDVDNTIEGAIHRFFLLSPNGVEGVATREGSGTNIISVALDIGLIIMACNFINVSEEADVISMPIRNLEIALIIGERSKANGHTSLVRHIVVVKKPKGEHL